MSSTAPFFLQQLTDNSGKPLSGGKLFSYVGGSTNLPKALYYDKDFTAPCPNPLIADASGTLPQYFLTSGFYKFEVKTSADVLISTRDYVQAGGVGSSSSEYKVKTSNSDTNPDYLSSKIVPGDGMDVNEIVGTTRQIEIASKGLAKVSMGDSAGYLDSKFTSSPSITFGTNGHILSATVNSNGVNGLYKVKTTSTDTAGYMSEKVMEGAGIEISTINSVDSDKALLFRHRGNILSSSDDTSRVFLSDAIKDSSSITWSRTKTNGITELSADVNEQGKVAITSGDQVGYLNTKLKAGAGITLTSVVDSVDGMQLWIDSKANFWSPVKIVDVATYTATDSDATIAARFVGGECNIVLPEANSTRKGRSYRVVNQAIGSYAGESVEVKAYNGTIKGSGKTSLNASEVGNYTCLPLSSGSNTINYSWVAW